jgi:hypothetical protein
MCLIFPCYWAKHKSPKSIIDIHESLTAYKKTFSAIKATFEFEKVSAHDSSVRREDARSGEAAWHLELQELRSMHTDLPEKNPRNRSHSENEEKDSSGASP